MKVLSYGGNDDLRNKLYLLGIPYSEAIDKAIVKQSLHFYVRDELTTDEARMRYDLHFYKLDGRKDYTLDYYKAVLLQNIPIPVATINDINTTDLDRQMDAFNWLSDLPSKLTGVGIMTSDKEENKRLLHIYQSLKQLGQTREGLKIVRLLEAKHLSNTAFVRDTSLQALYDRIEEQHGISRVFNLRKTTSPTLKEAYAMLHGDMPFSQNACEKQLIYKVELKRMTLQHFGDAYSVPGHPTTELHYFTTLKKAAGYIDFFDSKYYNIWTASKEKLPVVLKTAQVVDDFDDELLATKKNINLLLGMQPPVLSWQVNENKITVQSFEKQTGLSIRDKLVPDNDSVQSTRRQSNTTNSSKKSAGKRKKSGLR
jgi:hypothetical protein